MLETVRQFGLEQLAASGEEEEVRRRHLIYFVALAERLAERISLPEAERVFARLDAKHDDMRAALAWAEASEAALGLRLARAMGSYWTVRGHLREGQSWLERALGWGSPTATPERARALSGLGWLTRFQGDFDRAEAAFREALRTAAAAGSRLTTASALTGLAMLDLDRGRYAEAPARLDEALALSGVGVGVGRWARVRQCNPHAPGADRARRWRPSRRGPPPRGGGAATASAGLRLGAEQNSVLLGRLGARPRRSRRRAGPLPRESPAGPEERRSAPGGKRPRRRGRGGGGAGRRGAGGPPLRGNGGAARAARGRSSTLRASGPRADLAAARAASARTHSRPPGRPERCFHRRQSAPRRSPATRARMLPMPPRPRRTPHWRS